MASPLAWLYGQIDAAKRKLADAVANPGAAAQQYVGQLNDDAGAGLDLLQQSAPPTGQTTPEGLAARQKLVEAMGQRYNPTGMGIFAGVRSLGANQIALRKAQGLEAKGTDPRQIWHETGWGRAPDGKWRYEIDDSDMLLRPGLDQVTHRLGNTGKPVDVTQIGSPLGTMSEVLDHPELLSAYRSRIGDIKPQLRIDPREAGGGAYNPGPGYAGGRAAEITAIGPTEQDLRSTIVHELQHATQHIEGFENGGNPKFFQAQGYGPRESFELYQRIMGEAEARLAEHRRDYNAFERQTTFPWEPSYFKSITGVPLDKLIGINTMPQAK